jgi:hypothetical protein
VTLCLKGEHNSRNVREKTVKLIKQFSNVSKSCDINYGWMNNFKNRTMQLPSLRQILDNYLYNMKDDVISFEFTQKGFMLVIHMDWSQPFSQWNNFGFEPSISYFETHRLEIPNYNPENKYENTYNYG